MRKLCYSPRPCPFPPMWYASAWFNRWASKLFPAWCLLISQITWLPPQSAQQSAHRAPTLHIMPSLVHERVRIESSLSRSCLPLGDGSITGTSVLWAVQRTSHSMFTG